MRIDKFTWCVRLTKTRAIASDFISKNKVKLNGQGVKPSREVSSGDIISFQKHNATFEYEVLLLLKNRVGAKLVFNHLRDITKSEEIEKYRIYQVSQSEYRQKGSGKPSTKNRRDLNEFMDEGFL